MSQEERFTHFDSAGGSAFSLRRALRSIDRSIDERSDDPLPMFLTRDTESHPRFSEDPYYEDANDHEPNYAEPDYAERRSLPAVLRSSRIFQAGVLAVAMVAIVVAMMSVGDRFALFSTSRTSLAGSFGDAATTSQAAAQRYAGLPATARAEASPPDLASQANAGQAGIETTSQVNRSARKDVLAVVPQSQPVIGQRQEPAAAAAPLRSQGMDSERRALFTEYKAWEAGHPGGTAQSPHGAEPVPPTGELPDAAREALFRQYQAWQIENSPRPRKRTPRRNAVVGTADARPPAAVR